MHILDQFADIFEPKLLINLHEQKILLTKSLKLISLTIAYCIFQTQAIIFLNYQ